MILILAAQSSLSQAPLPSPAEAHCEETMEANGASGRRASKSFSTALLVLSAAPAAGSGSRQV